MASEPGMIKLLVSGVTVTWPFMGALSCGQPTAWETAGNWYMVRFCAITMLHTFNVNWYRLQFVMWIWYLTSVQSRGWGTWGTAIVIQTYHLQSSVSVHGSIVIFDTHSASIGIVELPISFMLITATWPVCMTNQGTVALSNVANGNCASISVDISIQLKRQIVTYVIHIVTVTFGQWAWLRTWWWTNGRSVRSYNGRSGRNCDGRSGRRRSRCTNWGCSATISN